MAHASTTRLFTRTRSASGAACLALLLSLIVPARVLAQGDAKGEADKADAPAEAAAPATSEEAKAAKPAEEEEEDEEDEPEAKAETRASLGGNASVATATHEPAAAAPAQHVAESGCGRASIGSENGFRLGICGYAALNVMHDSTQSYRLGVHNNVLFRGGTYEGDHDQLQFSSRDSRITLEAAAPEQHGIKASGMLQFDFNGVNSADVTENDFYVLGPMRMRHGYLRAQTPVVDVLAGQYHDLFAWGGAGFYPATLAFLGVPGQIYHRQPQLRISKTIDAGALDFEVAVAATRPVAKASGVPDGQGGLRLALDSWTGATQQGYGQPGVAPAAIGVSGVVRRFEVNEFLARPADPAVATGWGFAANALLPIVPTKSNDDRGNGLTATVEFSTGTGISDLYTELTGGALFPLFPNDANSATPALYVPNIDSGIVTYDGNSELQTINWRAFVIGLQYYLPVFAGRIWIAGIYSRIQSDNIVELTPTPSRGFVYNLAEYFDGSLFVAATDSLQFGVSFQTVQQTFGDGVKARNNRSEFGAHFFF